MSGGNFTRTIAFLRKDLMEVLRQPRMIITLVIGPFLILLAFGLGYDSSVPVYDTIVVVPPDSGLEQRSGELEDAFGQEINLVEITHDETGARRRVADSVVDLLVVVPPDAAESIRANQQADIEIYHSQLDPFQRTFIELAANSAVEELNKAVLKEVIAEGQRESEPVEEALPAARAAVDSMSAANDRGEPLSGSDQMTLERSLLGIGALAGYRTGVVSSVGGEESGEGWAAMNRALEGSRDLRDPQATPGEKRETLAQLSDDLGVIESELATFRDVDPGVLVSPFSATVANARGIEVDYTHFYIPGVIALLLQHLAVSFAALSVVRERNLGSVELFRVSPLSAGEVLTGKYLAYLALGGLVAAGLTVGAVFGLGFQITGSWLWYTAVLFLVILGSLGLGFVISAVVRTESEAIQHAMILLLVSIFFSGFFIPLDRMNEVVRLISYLLPATYGIEATKQVAFLGAEPDPMILAGAAIHALILLVLARGLMRRRVVTGRQKVRAVPAPTG